MVPALFERHIIHTKQTVTTFPETCATNVTIGVGAHPAQEGGAMRTSILRVALLRFLSACSLLTSVNGQGTNPVPSIVANEAGARLALKEKNSVFSIELSANLPKSLHATLVAKILSPDDKLLAEASVSVHLSSTPQRAEVPLTWTPVNGLQEAASCRLLYEVRLEGVSVPALSGILSPYALIPDLFELRFLGLDAIGMGRTYVARVWATRPESDKPVPGVSLTASFGDEDEDTPKGMKAQARTNSRGEALLTFHLPEMRGAPDDQQVDLEIRGTRGSFRNRRQQGVARKPTHPHFPVRTSHVHGERRRKPALLSPGPER